MENIKTIGLRSIYAQLQPKQKQQRLCDITLPKEVEELVNNKLYINRFKWLYREYGEEIMLGIVKMARRKEVNNNCYYFASLCSKANIEATIANVKKYIAKAKAIAEVVKQRPTVFKGFIYKNIHRLSAERLTNALARSSDSINPGASFVLLTKL